MIDTQTRCDEFGLTMPEGCDHLADALRALGFTDWTYANDEQPSMGIQLAPATETSDWYAQVFYGTSKPDGFASYTVLVSAGGIWGIDDYCESEDCEHWTEALRMLVEALKLSSDILGRIDYLNEIRRRI